MSSVPLDGFPSEFLPVCPKCSSGSVNFQHTRHPFMWGKTELRLSCYTCGLVKYGDAAVRQALEVQLSRWTRQQNEDAAFRVALEKERIERLAQEAEAAREREERRARNAEAARLQAEQEAREALERKAQEKARREQEREEAARIAREEEEARIARAREEAARRQEEQERAERIAREEREREEQARKEHERVLREREEARIARERERARERSLRWAEIEVMRKRDAARMEELRRTLKRERDARYRENKRAAKARAAAAAPPVVKVKPPPPPAIERVTPCAWKGCSNPASPTSKYCSRTCSNHNARARYAARRVAAPPAPVSPEGGVEVNAEKRKAFLGRKARYEGVEDTGTTTESA